ncbi:hypothetical protein SCHPADRAFT_415924 [Schizopora paradoxa]|uniref:Uncharacterized protein n=1 Tax=Schizopora paradoxa TaxID=27342 RepID=A0A0H2RSP3_9AGAM|nr:hypothetical protein SCHPADRAFT_415924 [Schizopora paradoxa]
MNFQRLSILITNSLDESDFRLSRDRLSNSYLETHYYDILETFSTVFQLLTTHLVDFVGKDVPQIAATQQNQTDRYLNLTTISTFLSAVTISTLQIVTQGNDASSKGGLAVAVNSFLFSSIVFSTASAVQSMLAMTWLRSFVRRPDHHLPRWAFVWLTNGPTISLLIAGTFFSMGLVVLVFLLKQDVVTSTLTTLFTSIQALGIVILFVWFFYERWRFRIVSKDAGLELIKSSIILDTIGMLSKFILAIRAGITTLRDVTSRVCGTGKTNDPEVSVPNVATPEVPHCDGGSDTRIQMVEFSERLPNGGIPEPLAQAQDLSRIQSELELPTNATQIPQGVPDRLVKPYSIDGKSISYSPPEIIGLPPSRSPSVLPEQDLPENRALLSHLEASPMQTRNFGGQKTPQHQEV